MKSTNVNLTFHPLNWTLNLIIMNVQWIAGHQCTAYDIAINSTFFLKVESNLLFQTFLITLAMEGLEDKYSMELDKNGSVGLNWIYSLNLSI